MPGNDPMAAQILVYSVVVEWVAAAVHIDSKDVDDDRKFSGNPPAGYGFDEGQFLKMCDEITPTLIKASGRALKLPGKWRVAHEDDSIGDFVTATAVAVLAAPLTPLSVQAHSWAMSS
jgi:hypothetical protein